MSQRQHRPWPVAWFFRFLVQLAVLVLLVYLVVRALGVRWEAGTGIAATRPASLEEVGQNLWAALGGLGQGVSEFLAPVVARYGIEVTIVLIGVLLLSVGYLVFIRSR